MFKKALFYNQIDTKGSIGLLLLRLVAGSAMIVHGYSKIQEPFSWMGADSGIPSIFQALAAISEFGGGIAWVLGLLTPLASLGLVSTMAVAVQFHMSKGDPFVGREGSFEPALGYLAIALTLLLVGPGRFSLDALIFGRKQKNNCSPGSEKLEITNKAR